MFDLYTFTPVLKEEIDDHAEIKQPWPHSFEIVSQKNLINFLLKLIVQKGWLV